MRPLGRRCRRRGTGDAVTGGARPGTAMQVQGNRSSGSVMQAQWGRTLRHAGDAGAGGP